MITKKHIIIIDDEPSITELFQSVLEDKGYRVTAFNDPRDFIEKVDELQPDVVLADLQMPWINGLQIVEKLGTLLPSVEVIIFSAFATETSRNRARDLGAYSVLEKPVHFPELLETVEHALLSNRVWRTRNGAHANMMNAPKVLLIDDYVPLLEVMADFLRTEGFQVNTASSGKEGIKKAMLEHYSFVIADIAMPDINGVEVIKQLHGAEPGLPIYVYTGEATSEEIVEAKKAGALEVFIKPLSPEKLIAEINHKAHEMDEQQRRARIIEEHKNRWKSLPLLKRADITIKIFWHRRKRTILTVFLTVLIIVLALWILLDYNNKQLKIVDKPRELSPEERVIRDFKGYLDRDEQRDLNRKR